MQKKLIFLALTGLLCLSLAGCGQSGSTSPEGGSSPQAEQPAEETAGEDGGRTPEEDGADTEAPQYTDNFSIDTEAVTAFAEQIQAAVAEKDLEVLADLASVSAVHRLFRWRGICGVPGGPDRTGSGPDLLRRAGL